MAVSRATRRGPNTFVKFVQLTRASTHTPLVKLRVGGAELSVEPGFDACLLQAVVAALRGTP